MPEPEEREANERRGVVGRRQTDFDPLYCPAHERMMRDMEELRQGIRDQVACFDSFRKWMIGLLFLVFSVSSGIVATFRAESQADIIRVEREVVDARNERMRQLESIDSKLYQLMRLAGEPNGRGTASDAR